MSENENANYQENNEDDFERMGIVEEFIMFLKENKAFWLAPIIIVLLLMILLVVVGGGSAPFIYTLF
jgi:hypothetical protein